MRDIDTLLDAMWRDYLELNPEARGVHELFTSLGERVVNDHIALRTFDLPEIGIEVLSRPFVELGYRARGEYEFPEKRLRAVHFEHPRADLPLVFISALKVDELPVEVGAILRRLVAQIPKDASSRQDFCFSGRPWELSYSTYERLLTFSEYAAWVAAFGFRPNHFTVLVNALSHYPSLEAVNSLLEEHGFRLNSSGGKIKGHPEQLLEQSSTLANSVDLPFSDGLHRVPTCYYEFARRYPAADGTLYRGFIAASADKIFESTDRAQVS